MDFSRLIGFVASQSVRAGHSKRIKVDHEAGKVAFTYIIIYALGGEHLLDLRAGLQCGLNGPHLHVKFACTVCWP